MLFSNLELSRRLERAEGRACVAFAEARKRGHPSCSSEWMECSGAFVVFDGIDSPVTQTFGLGLFEELTAPSLETIEEFFLVRGAPIQHEVSPFAGLTTLGLLCERGYKPMEINSVLCRRVESPDALGSEDIRVRPIEPEETQLWAEINARGWSHEHPELRDFVLQMGRLAAVRDHTVSFLAELDGIAGAAGSLCMHQGVALFGGATTVPELRRRGLQTALLTERMRYAHRHGCDLAMMVTEAGSASQRNAERSGFAIAYTRLKWRLGAS